MSRRLARSAGISGKRTIVICLVAQSHRKMARGIIYGWNSSRAIAVLRTIARHRCASKQVSTAMRELILPESILPPELFGERFVSLDEAASLRSTSKDSILRDPRLSTKIVEVSCRRKAIKLKYVLAL